MRTNDRLSRSVVEGRQLEQSYCGQRYFPAYGKKIMKLRQSGKIPSQIIMVVFDWEIAKSYPRIVIPDEVPIEKLEFTYLTGLPVQIVYYDKDAHRIDVVVQAILKVNPCFIATFGLDLLDTEKARMLIKPYEVIQDKEGA